MTPTVEEALNSLKESFYKNVRAELIEQRIVNVIGPRMKVESAARLSAVAGISLYPARPAEPKV